MNDDIKNEAARAAPAIPTCSCETCLPNTFSNMRMVLCQMCGNKRCPHANDHRNACTGSNEPGQPGSSYAAPAIPQAIPEGFMLVPNLSNMTDDQAEAIAMMAGCCGGIAHDIYRAALDSAPVPPDVPQADEPMTQEEFDRYAALEKEHLGDPDKQTGIYAPTPNSLATRKTAHVMSQGYQIVGHVLFKQGVGYALSAEGAVRWLKQPECWKLMHGPFDSAITASLSRNMSGDDLLVLSTGQTFLLKDLPGWNAAREVDADYRHDAERWRMHLSMMTKNGYSVKAIGEIIDAVNAQIEVLKAHLGEEG